MTPSEAPATTNPYALSSAPPEAHPPGVLASAAGGSRRCMATERPSVCHRLRRRRRLVAGGAAGAAHHRRTRSTPTSGRGDFAGVLRSAALLLVIYLAAFVATYVQTQTHGQRRPARAVQAAQRALHEAAAPAARLLQPEQGRRPDLAHQQRHRQAEPVLRAGLVQLAANLFLMAGAGDLSAGAQRPPRPRGAGARPRRVRADAHDRTVGAGARTSRACSRSAA